MKCFCCFVSPNASLRCVHDVIGCNRVALPVRFQCLTSHPFFEKAFQRGIGDYGLSGFETDNICKRLIYGKVF